MRRDPGQVAGYTYHQLARAFDRVRDPRDWRKPVRAEIPVEMEELVAHAVVLFTGTVPAFAATERGRLLATAPGYLEGPLGRGDDAPEPARATAPTGAGQPAAGDRPGGEEQHEPPTLTPTVEPDDPWGFRGPAFGR